MFIHDMAFDIVTHHMTLHTSWTQGHMIISTKIDVMFFGKMANQDLFNKNLQGNIKNETVWQSISTHCSF